MSNTISYPPVQLLIFDFDGVLVDTQYYINQIQCRFLNERGFAVNLDDFIQRFSGLRINQIVKTLEEELGQKTVTSPEMLSFEMDETVKRELSNQALTPFPGTMEVLEVIHKPKCIASNCSADLLQNFVSQADLKKFFDSHVYSAESIGRFKPDPDIFLYAAKCEGVEPEACLVIEDSAAGVTAAKTAGMRVIGFVGGSHVKPDHEKLLKSLGAEIIITDLRQLLPYLREEYGFPHL